jgi:hypothetical protein
MGIIKYPIINHYLTLLFISESCKNKVEGNKTPRTGILPYMTP